MEQDRRESKRGDIFLVVEFKPFKVTAGHATGITKDLSSEGFCLEAQGFDFQRGQVMEFRLRSLQNDLTVAALGEIAWIKNSWYKFSAGIKFLDPDEETKARIQELMSFVRRPYKPFSSSEVPEIESTPVKKGLPEPDDGKKEITDNLMPDLAGVEAGPDLKPAGPDEDEIKKEDICLEPPGQDEPFGTAMQVPPAAEPAGEVEEVKEKTERVEGDEASETKPDQESVLQSEEPGDKGLEPDIDQESRDDIETDDTDAAERGEKKDSRRYAPVAMIFAALFVAALLVTLRHYNVSLESLNSVFTGLTSFEDVETGGQAFNEPLDSEAVQPDQGESVLFTEEYEKTGPEQLPALQDVVIEMASDLPAGSEEEKLSGTTPAKIEKIPEPEPDDTEIRRVKPVIDIEKASSGVVMAKIEALPQSTPAAEIKKPLKTKPVALPEKTAKAGSGVKEQAVAETGAAAKKAKSSGTGKGIKLRRRAKAKIKKIPETAPDDTGIRRVKPVIDVEKASSDEVIAKIEAPSTSGPAAKIKRSFETKPVALADKTAKAGAGVKGEAVAETGSAAKKVKSPETGKGIKPLKGSQSETVVKSRKSLETKPQETSVQVKSPKLVMAAEKVPEAGSGSVQGSLETLEAEPEQVTEKSVMTEPVVEKKKFAEDKLNLKMEKPSSTELAGERAEPAKTGTIAGTQKVPKVALFLRRDKPRNIKKESSVKVDSAKRRWKNIGKTRNGIPLFMDSASISYPSLHIVQLFMKAVVDEKEFMDLVKIDCLRNKLRIIKEGLEKNPLLSPYSTEWRDIIPESMPLYDAVCPEAQ